MRFILTATGLLPVAFWAAITVNFLLPRLLPGNPIDYFLARYQSQLAANPHLLDSLRPAFDFKHQSLPSAVRAVSLESAAPELRRVLQPVPHSGQ